MTTKDALALQFLIEPARIDADGFARLWARLADPAVGITTYDIKQPTKRPYDSDAAAVFELLRFRLLLALSGDGVRGTLEWDKLFGVQLWVDRERVDEQLRQWAIDLFRDFPIVYGYACSNDEFDGHHYHERPTIRGAGARDYGHQGTALKFPEYLPAVYWLNLLGPELTAGLPLASVDAIEGVRRDTVAEGKTVLSLDGPPFVDDPTFDARMALSRKVAAALGDDYFYDRDRPERTLRTVSTLEPLRQRMAQAK